MLKIIASEKKIKPDIYDLSIEDYHRGPGISRSGLMEFKRSPYHYWYQYLNPDYKPVPSTPAQTLGNALHSYVLEPESLAERYFVIPSFNKRTKSGAERWKLVKLEIGEREILSEDQWQIVQAMADSLRKNKLALQLLENAQTEQSLYWTDPDTHILCKCRPDIINKTIVADLKTTGDASVPVFQRSILNYGYHLQAAMIQEAFIHLQDITIEAFLFIAIEKSAPYSCAIYQLDQASLDKGREEFKSLLHRYQECLSQNHWPSYTSQEISLPHYAFN